MENRRALLALLPDDTLLQHLNVDPKWDEANTVLSDAVGCLMLLVPVAPAHSLALFVSALSLAVSRLPIPHSRAPLTLQVLCGCQRLFSADVLTKGLWRGALMMMRFCTRSLLPLGPHLLICEPVFCVCVYVCISHLSPSPFFPLVLCNMGILQAPSWHPPRRMLPAPPSSHSTPGGWLPLEESEKMSKGEGGDEGWWNGVLPWGVCWSQPVSIVCVFFSGARSLEGLSARSSASLVRRASACLPLSLSLSLSLSVCVQLQLE